jgi:SM-20-related protein
MDVFDLGAFRNAPLQCAPYEHLVVPSFIKPDALRKINADYPPIEKAGSFLLDSLHFGPNFQALVDALESEEFRNAFEEKFQIDLSNRPTAITVRGRCDKHDGKIHCDTESKLITVLLYLNPTWTHAGGHLRLLRSSKDINDVAIEVPPVDGTLVTFLRSDHSWHGHLPFVGERRVVQFNWLRDPRSLRLARLRHRLSASVKRILSLNQSR